MVFGLRAMVPLLAATRGHAVVTASLAGMTSVPFDPVYAMTKHAVIGLVRGYALTLAARGVGLHAVCPAWWTPRCSAPPASSSTGWSSRW